MDTQLQFKDKHEDKNNNNKKTLGLGGLHATTAIMHVWNTKV